LSSFISSVSTGTDLHGSTRPDSFRHSFGTLRISPRCFFIEHRLSTAFFVLEIDVLRFPNFDTTLDRLTKSRSHIFFVKEKSCLLSDTIPTPTLAPRFSSYALSCDLVLGHYKI
jgi:hypothetical protein